MVEAVVMVGSSVATLVINNGWVFFFVNSVLSPKDWLIGGSIHRPLVGGPIKAPIKAQTYATRSDSEGLDGWVIWLWKW